MPYYVQISRKRLALRTSHMADMVLNLSGFLTALLHFFLRSNADRLAIRLIHTPWSENRRICFFGPNELSIPMVISPPLLLARDDNRANIVPAGRLQYLKATTQGLESCVGQTDLNPHRIPRPTNLTQSLNVTERPKRTRSTYSIFPTRASARQLSWSTTHSASSEIIQLPQPLFARRHRRDDSDQTSETVQIGMRLSHAMYNEHSSQAESQLPVQAMTPLAIFPSHASSYHGQSPGKALAQVQMRQIAQPTLGSVQSFNSNNDTTAQHIKAQRESHGPMKSLPPVPKLPIRYAPSGLRSHPPDTSMWPLISNSLVAKETWI